MWKHRSDQRESSGTVTMSLLSASVLNVLNDCLTKSPLTARSGNKFNSTPKFVRRIRQIFPVTRTFGNRSQKILSGKTSLEPSSMPVLHNYLSTLHFSFSSLKVPHCDSRKVARLFDWLSTIFLTAQGAESCFDWVSKVAYRPSAFLNNRSVGALSLDSHWNAEWDSIIQKMSDQIITFLALVEDMHQQFRLFGTKGHSACIITFGSHL